MDELGDIESAAHTWAMDSVDKEMRDCECGHQGLGINWHSYECAWAGGAARRALFQLARWCDGAGPFPFGDEP